MPPLDDHQLAAEIAAAAGRLLKTMRTSPALTGRALGAAGDAAANALISNMLEHARPGDGLLSEEASPDPGRLSMRRVWVVDPLDGTREYGEAAEGRPDWAVHVALTEGGRPTACAVSLPALDCTLSTAAPRPRQAAPAGGVRILVSRTRAPAIAAEVARALGAELVPMGSAGAKAMAVLRGEAHAYLHDGGQYEWDSCAPVGVALAAGLFAGRIDGSPCVYNRPDPSMPDLLVCHPEFKAPMLAAIAAALGKAER
jgi:3'(2'), 5'-bisphosphate nucleotidase